MCVSKLWRKMTFSMTHEFLTFTKQKITSSYKYISSQTITTANKKFQEKCLFPDLQLPPVIHQAEDYKFLLIHQLTNTSTKKFQGDLFHDLCCPNNYHISYLTVITNHYGTLIHIFEKIVFLGSTKHLIW